jgi:glycosyltransferase involved in cell wall biosynthesis
MAIILHVINSFFSVPYFIGGQFLHFKKMGHKLYLICPESEFLESYSNEMEFTYKNIEITRTYSPLKDLLAIIRISVFARKKGVDILVGHTPKGAFLAMIAGWIAGIPERIYFRHGLVYETASGLNRKLLKIAEKITSYCSTRIICVSPSLALLSLKDKLNPESKQFLLGKGTCGGIDTHYKFNPYCIDNEKVSELRNKYNIKAEDIVIGFCGRLVQDKGIAELIKSHDRLRSQLPGKRIVLLLVGVFEERDKLPQDIIEKISTDSDIVHTGFVFRDIQYFYSLMDIYILPSYREGFGMSVIEASAMEIPVLTTRATGCVDSIIENHTGRYIDITPNAITEGVMDYINNPDLALLHGKNGRLFVQENFDNLLIWRYLEQFYCDGNNSRQNPATDRIK